MQKCRLSPDSIRFTISSEFLTGALKSFSKDFNNIFKKTRYVYEDDQNDSKDKIPRRLSLDSKVMSALKNKI